MSRKRGTSLAATMLMVVAVPSAAQECAGMGFLDGGGAAGVRSALVEAVPVVGASAWIDPPGAIAYHGSAGVALPDHEDEGGWYARGRVYYAPRIPAWLVPCMYVGADLQRSRARVPHNPPDEVRERGLGAWFGLAIGGSLPASGVLVNPYLSAQIGYIHLETEYRGGNRTSSYSSQEVGVAAASGVTIQWRRFVVGLTYLIVAEDYGTIRANDAYGNIAAGPELRLAWVF